VIAVVDASSILPYLFGTGSPDERAAFLGQAHAPDLVDVEVTHALRGLLRAGQIVRDEAETARTDLDAAQVRRHPGRYLLPRAWELRDVCSTYDALYVALAEALDATLVTRDERLARGVSHLVPVVVTSG
jgi:predicted nucleic acid-binding protein